jgi:AcrR family transcriptional regulator
MPHLLDTHDRVEMLTDAAIHLIETDGVTALTVRRLAGVMRLSPSTLTAHLTDKHRMIDLVTKTVGSRLVRSIEFGGLREGISGFVPEDEQLRLVRAWLAMSELARADDQLGSGAAGIEQDLRDALAAVARLRVRDTLTLDALVAVVNGLWRARCDRIEPIAATRARAVLRHACAALEVAGGPEAA